MLKIRAIKLVVNTSNGLYGAEYEFTSGLNIIRGNNTAGKSTLYQALIYGLGMEELLGGKNEKTMQSVLKDEIESGEIKTPVLESEVFLEIENESIVTLRRPIKAQNKNTKLIEVYPGSLIVEKQQGLVAQPMYVHDGGAAQDIQYGFHAFLENFMGWDLPEVNYINGNQRKLYIQTIFPTFIIEQKTGWSDFLATIPYFGLRNSESRAVEFLLNLDVWINEKKKQDIAFEKQSLTNRWEVLFQSTQELAKKGNCIVKGISNKPTIINEDDSKLIFLQVSRESKEYTLSKFLQLELEEYSVLKGKEINSIGQNIERNDAILNELQNKISSLSLNHDLLFQDLLNDQNRLVFLEKQLLEIEEDLRKNKAINKVKSFGANLNLSLADDNCPTCHQSIKDTLLSQDLSQVPMRIEENIDYLSAQKSMIEAYINGLKRLIKNREIDIDNAKNEIAENRQVIRTLKKELTSDERLPSIVDIEKRLNAEKRIQFYTQLGDDFLEIKDKFISLSKEWKTTLAKQENLPKDMFSSEDWKKIKALENSTRSLLKNFGYSSKSIAEVKISLDKYLPVVENYNIRFDSSASDLIRAIWSYTCSLYKVSLGNNGNHPGLLMFDEPGQHSMSDSSLRAFLEELCGYKTAQTIVAASFNNEEEIYKATTKDLPFHLVQLEGKLIKEIN